MGVEIDFVELFKEMIKDDPEAAAEFLVKFLAKMGIDKDFFIDRWDDILEVAEGKIDELIEAVKCKK